MSDKPPDGKDDPLELLNKLWLPIAGLIGVVTLVYNFYKLWLGDQATVTYITAGVALIVLVVILYWTGFSKKTIYLKVSFPIGAKIPETNPRYPQHVRGIAWFALGMIFLGTVAGAYLLAKHRQELSNKLVILIPAFEGPEEVYGLRNEIIENLNANFSNDDKVKIISADEVITVVQGSDYARNLGKRYLADVVIWGWYRPTENPNIVIHVENLTREKTLPLEESTTLKPTTTLAELESFTFQQQIGEETSALISTLAGFIDYNNEDYVNAIKRFNNSLKILSEPSQLFVNEAEINYYYRANANLFANNFQLAIQDYDQAIQINPQDAVAYGSRGIAYDELGEYRRAIQDYDQALQIRPQDAVAYGNRGAAYADLGEYQNAIQSYDQAIQINPQDVEVYRNRGNAYVHLGKDQRAIQDYDQAIQINPQDADLYYGRGIAYGDLGEYRRAIQDYDQAIHIDPKFATAYNNRGYAYTFLGEYQNAIQSYDQAIQINPQFAVAYNNRGVVYAHLGEYQRAIQDYNQTILINPQFAAVYKNRGNAEKNLGKTTEAESDFKKYEELTGQKP